MPAHKRQLAYREVSNIQGSAMGSTPGTSVPAHASSNSTKGTATELVAAASVVFDVMCVEIYISNYGLLGTSAKGMLDLLIGSSLTTVLVADLLCGNAGGSSVLGEGGVYYRIPILIPAGTRVGAQLAGERTGVSGRVAIRLHEKPEAILATKVVTYKGASAIPDAVPVTASNGGEGAWIQVVAATSEDHIGFFSGFQAPTDTSLTPNKQFVRDIGVGTATEALLCGFEQSRISRYGTGELCDFVAGNDYIACPVPSGTRMTMRLGTNGGADAAAPQVALYGLSS